MRSKIFVICTPNDSVRQQSLNKELSAQVNVPLEIEYFPAIMDTAQARRGINRSHKAIIAKAKELDLDEVVVLEDDLMCLCPNALTKLINVSKWVPKDCSLLMGGLYEGEIVEEFSTYARVKGKVAGMHAYVCKKAFYDTFLSADEAWNIDSYLSMETDAVIYCMYPMLILQHEFFSYNSGGKGTYNYNLFVKKPYKLFGRSE